MAKPKKQNSVVSPIQMRVTVSQFKRELIQHLNLLTMPVAEHTRVNKCMRDCHIIERNQTVEALKHFIKNMGV